MFRRVSSQAVRAVALGPSLVSRPMIRTTMSTVARNVPVLQRCSNMSVIHRSSMLASSSFRSVRLFQTSPINKQQAAEDREVAEEPGTAPPPPERVDRYLSPASFMISRKTAILQTKVVPLQLRTTAQGHYSVAKRGYLLMEFANRIGQSPEGTPQQRSAIDWRNKVTFGLDIRELGELLARKPDSTCTFRHAPRNGPTKVLSIYSAEDGGTAFQISTTGSSAEESKDVVVNVSNSEVAALKTLIEGVIPALQGWTLASEPVFHESENAEEVQQQ